MWHVAFSLRLTERGGGSCCGGGGSGRVMQMGSERISSPRPGPGSARGYDMVEYAQLLEAGWGGHPGGVGNSTALRWHKRVAAAGNRTLHCSPLSLDLRSRAHRYDLRHIMCQRQSIPKFERFYFAPMPSCCSLLHFFHAALPADGVADLFPWQGKKDSLAAVFIRFFSFNISQYLKPFYIR